MTVIMGIKAVYEFKTVLSSFVHIVNVPTRL